MVLTSVLIFAFNSDLGLAVTLTKIAADIIGIVATYVGLRELVFARMQSSR